ncbi:cupin domain-containing protein [Nostoc sp.]|uniref:cupin domain-containing protein n=1 Tax=Nostoc sp. TaxID=1180 RepID=UPI002FF7A21F
MISQNKPIATSLSMATVKKLSVAVTGAVFSLLVSTSKGEAVDAPAVNFPKITSPPSGEAFDFPEVKSDPNPQRILFAEGEQISFLKTSEDTGGKYVLMDIIIPPGGGPPPHIHHRSDEWFYFIDPGFTLYMGDETYPDGVIPGIDTPKANIHAINAKPGTLFYGPRDHIHAHQNTGTTPARELVVLSPSADTDKWFQAAGLPITDSSNPPALDPSKLASAISTGPNYGLTLSSNFNEFVQTVDSNYPDEMVKDNHADELIALLSNDTRQVPEPSSLGGVLVFSIFCAISILKRKHKSVSKVTTVVPKTTQNYSNQNNQEKMATCGIQN